MKNNAGDPFLSPLLLFYLKNITTQNRKYIYLLIKDAFTILPTLPDLIYK